MRLTDYTDYSLRTLIYVAVHPGELVTIQRIADAFDIPKNHLIKIVQKLGQDGFLRLHHAPDRLERGRPSVAVGPEEGEVDADGHVPRVANHVEAARAGQHRRQRR